MRFALIAPLALFTIIAAAVLSTAQAASAVSSKFDGQYNGVAVPSPGASALACQGFALAPVSISQGALSSEGVGAHVEGFVTEEGFVTGKLTRPGKNPSTFEGRFVNGKFAGGVIDDTERCSWTVSF